jgi:hypothetical protein
MSQELAMARISRLASAECGVFRGRDAVADSVTRDQLTRLSGGGIIERVLPDTYRHTAVPPSSEQRLHAALLWAGREAAAAGRAAGEHYGLEGIRAADAEIVIRGT